jgi:hypothetical protein
MWYGDKYEQREGLQAFSSWYLYKWKLHKISVLKCVITDHSFSVHSLFKWNNVKWRRLHTFFLELLVFFMLRNAWGTSPYIIYRMKASQCCICFWSDSTVCNKNYPVILMTGNSWLEFCVYRMLRPLNSLCSSYLRCRTCRALARDPLRINCSEILTLLVNTFTLEESNALCT